MIHGMQLVRLATICAFATVIAGPVSASDAPGGGFALPVDCVVGTTCWIVNYPDAAPGAVSRDHKCNHLSYDGHKGTDFAVRDLAALRDGVRVLAGAAGRVVRTRDGMADTGPPAPAGRDCGNGVLLSHGGGWETQYCHMRRGSVGVRPGNTVGRGARLGLVGMSGRAAFPHVHLEIRQGGNPLDPFTGQNVFTGCGQTGSTLWHSDARPTYEPFQIYAAGFATAPVSMAAIQRIATGPTVLRVDSPALVLWAAMFGVEPGDRVSLRITGPDGRTVFTHRRELDRTQIRRLDFGGRRLRSTAWAPGVYTGEVRLSRAGSGGPGERTIRTRVTIR